jgi:hypothetical protein
MSAPIATGGSAFGLKPAFTDREGYCAWRKAWRSVYRDLSVDIRRRKRAVKALQRADAPSCAMQKALRHDSVVAWKMNSLLAEAKARWKRIRRMHTDLAEQRATFPVEIPDCPVIDFHYNRGSNEFGFLPRWVVKTKGRSFYVDHVTANVPWTTRELDTGATRGTIRLRKANLQITKDGEAVINAAA